MQNGKSIMPTRASELMVSAEEWEYVTSSLTAIYQRVNSGLRTARDVELLEREKRNSDRGMPNVSYFICFINRSGSNFLSECLWRCGYCGFPQEYLNPEPDHAIERLSKQFEVRTFNSYLTALTNRRQSENKVFGTKIAYLQLAYIHEMGLLASHFPNVKYVIMQRSDKLMQAISWCIAEQTRAWSIKECAQREPVFDAREIIDKLQYILYEQSRFENFFALTGIEPLTLIYENLILDPVRAVNAVHQFLDGRDPVHLDLDKVEIREQKTELNMQWAQEIRSRFRGGLSDS